MLLCVTPNPAIDHSVWVPNMERDGVNRAQRSLTCAGGKGTNVARAAKLLGHKSLCMGFAGGRHGALLEELARDDELDTDWTSILNETRTCTIVVDTERGENTVINEPGPLVTEADWTRLIDLVIRRCEGASGLCVCGSVPPGSPLPSYQHLLHSALQSGIPVWVDVSGSPLRVAANIHGLRIKINRNEASTLLERSLESVGTVAEAANQLVRNGMRSCVVTLGSDGAILASQSGSWLARPTPVTRVNAVGSGDSFLAGLATAQIEGRSDAESLAWGIAAGTANAASDGGARFTRAKFDQVLDQVRVEPL